MAALYIASSSDSPVPWWLRKAVLFASLNQQDVEFIVYFVLCMWNVLNFESPK